MFIGEAMMDKLVASRDYPTGLRLALPQRARVAESTVRYIRCPVCGNVMNRTAFARISRVIVDVCRGHGVWFDAGELSAVLAFIEQGGLEQARRRELDEIAAKTRALHAEEARVSSASLHQTAALERSGGSSRDGRASALTELLSELMEIWTGRGR